MQKLFLVLAVVLVATLGVSAILLQTKENLLIGSWLSNDAVYGVREHLVFTEFGLYEKGSHIPATYQVNRQETIVTTDRSSIEYMIVTDDVIKKRVPRSKWRFYTREGSEIAKDKSASNSEVNRY